MAPLPALPALPANVASSAFSSGPAVQDGSSATNAHVAGAVKELDDRLLLNRRGVVSDADLSAAARRLTKVVQTTEAAQPAWAVAMEARIKASGANTVARIRNQSVALILSSPVHKPVKEKEGLGNSLPSTTALHCWTPAPGDSVPEVGAAIGPDLTWGEVRDLGFVEVDRYARLFNHNFGITDVNATLRTRVRALEHFFLGGSF